MSSPSDVSVSIEEQHAARSRLRIQTIYRVPAGVDAGSIDRIGETDLTVVTRLEVRTGERFVRVEIEVDNTADDHRLRWHLPLTEPATHSRAECAFTVVERVLVAEGGPTERAMSTFPSRRFVQAGGVTVAHEGLTEYELVDIADDRAHEMAFTVIRATGYLSRGPMTYRPLPAGPIVRLNGSQMRSCHSFRAAVSVDSTINPYDLVDDAFTPLLVAHADDIGVRPARGSALTLAGAPVSSVRRRPDGLEVRVFNPSDESATVTMSIESSAVSGVLVDLSGQPSGEFEGAVTLAPHRIVTVRTRHAGVTTD